MSELNLTSRFLYDEVMEEPGIVSYNMLNDSYIITIMPFDIFGYDRYMYTFVAKCVEEPECELRDGATRIFLNTRGKNDSEVSKELRDFLHYIEHTTDETAEQSESERIQKIHEQVRKVKLSEEAGVKYMQAWEEKCYEREEGREEGRKEGLTEALKLNLLRLVIKKLKKGKSPNQIAEDLEEELSVILPICEAAEGYAPEYPEEQIFEELKK